MCWFCRCVCVLVWLGLVCGLLWLDLVFGYWLCFWCYRCVLVCVVWLC